MNQEPKGKTIDFTKGDRPPAGRRRPKKAEPSTASSIGELLSESRVNPHFDNIENFFSFCDGLSKILYAMNDFGDENVVSNCRHMMVAAGPILEVLADDVREFIQEAAEAHQKLGKALSAKGLID